MLSLLSMEVNVFVDEDLDIKLDTTWLKRLAKKILIVQRLSSNIELGLVVVDQERIHQLNLSYLGRDKPTDVLAFPLISESRKGKKSVFVVPPDGIEHLGEVIISYPQVVIQAKEHGHSVRREITILIIHGMLHLLGYDHAKPKEEYIMRVKEAEILDQLEDN